MGREIAIAPTEVVFNITYRCPLRCSHCCFSSDMSKQGHLSESLMIQAVEDAAAVSSIERIDFVGGDPFLHTDLMLKALQRSKMLGIGASATTSAYWAPTPDKAARILAPLVAAGLTRIIISYDDMHAEFLDVNHVVNAYRAAHDLGMDVLIAVVINPGCTIDANVIYETLQIAPGSDPKLKVYETAVSSTGRADETADASVREARRQSDKVYRGPCHSALRQFSITPSGKVLPCCGVLPYREEMAVGDLTLEPVIDAMARAYDNAIMKWIAFEGPVALLRQVTAGTDQPLHDEDFDGICHACDVLFASPALLARAREKLSEKMPSLAIAETIFVGLDLFRPPGK
jgi:MoaA/NifB/PqqE/SkfB family radical SAM enzyme